MPVYPGGSTFRYVPNPLVIDAVATTVGSEAVAVLVQEMVQVAKDIAPFDTGDYQASIGGSFDGLRATLYSDIRYAPYLEFGTSDTPTFATLRRASEMAHLPPISGVI